jgi:hypothetical protein
VANWALSTARLASANPLRAPLGHGMNEDFQPLETSMTDNKVKGPASYFPSIEKTYGRPISDWQKIVRGAYPAKHMELVAVLKNDHGIGHGHANAIVAHTLAEDGLK